MVNVLRKSQNLIVIGVICAIALLTTCKNNIGLGETIDINPPKIDASTLYPPAGSVIRDCFTLSVATYDDTEVTAVTATIVDANTGTQLEGTHGLFNLKKTADVTKKADGTQWTRWEALLNEKNETTGYLIKDGQYKVKLLVRDDSGKDVLAETTFTIDNTPPLLILNRPSTAITQDVSLKDSSPDVFGAEFLLVGQVYDKAPVASLNISAEGNGTKQEKTLYNIPQNIRLTVDSFPSTNTDKPFYTPLYGSDDTAGSKKYAYTIAVTDSAKEYKNPGDSGSGTGNTTSNYYLFDDLYTDVLSKYKIQDIYAMLHGTSSDSGRSAVDQQTAEAVRKELAANKLGGDGENARKGTFALNPSLNPRFAIVGESPVAKAEIVKGTKRFSPFYSGNALKVKMSRNLDETPLEDAGKYRFFLMEWSKFVAAAGNLPSFYPTEMINGSSVFTDEAQTVVNPTLNLIEIRPNLPPETTGSSYLFTLPILKKAEISYNTNYVLLVRGADKDGNKLMPDFRGDSSTAYGFYFVKIGKVPEVYVTKINETVGTGADNSITERVYLKKGDSLTFKMKLQQTDANVTYTLKGTVGGGISDTKPYTVDPNTKVGEYEVTIDKAKFNQDADGTYKLIVKAEADTVTSLEQTYTVVYDVKAPEAEITTLVNKAVINEANGTAFSVSGTVFDASAGLDQGNPVTVTLSKIDGDSPFTDRALTVTTTDGRWSTAAVDLSSSGYGEGKYELSVTAKDKLGQTATQSRTFYYDKKAPEITELKVNDKSVTNGGTVYTKTTPVTVTGKVTETYGTETFIINSSSDNLPSTSPDSPTASFNKPLPFSEEGRYPNVAIVLKDKAGQAAQDFTFDVVVDKTAPEFVTTSGTSDENIKFAGALASGESSDGEISTSDNPVRITGLIEDPVSGGTASGIKEVYYAVEEHTVTTVPSSHWKQLNGTLDDKNYKVDGYIERFPTATLPVGKTIHIKAVDNAGNEAFFKHKVKVTSVEPAKLTFKIPEGTLGDPNNPSDTTAYIVKKHAGTLYAKGKFKITIGGYLDPVPTDNTITIKIEKKTGTTATDESPSSFFTDWTGHEPKILTTDTPKDYVLANAPDAGEYTFTMTAQGQEKVLTVVVDTEGPSVTPLEPVTTSVDTLRPVLSASIFDNAGIKEHTTEVHYKKAGDATFTSQPLTKGTDGSYSFTPAADMTEGTYTLYFSAEDNLGNKGKSVDKTVLIDTSKPSLTDVKIKGEGGNTVSVNTGFAVEGKADDVNGIEKIQILDDGQSIRETTVINPSTKAWSISFTDTDLSEGTHKLTIRAIDKAGKSTDVLKTVIMDKTAPTVELTYPAATSAQSGKITIQGSIDDGAQGSGVKAAATKWIVVPSASGGPTAGTAGWKAMKTSTAANWSLTLDFTADLASGGGHTAYGPQNTGTPAYYDIPVYILTEDKVENKVVRKITVLYNPDGTKPVVEVLSPTAESIVGGTIQIFGTGTVAVGTPDDVGEVHIQFSTAQTFNSANCTINGKDWWNSENGVLVPNTDGTNSGASWSIDVNGDGKLNKPDPSPPNPADDGRWELWFRLRAQNKTDNKMGEWTAPIKIVIDKFAPTIGSKIPLKLEHGSQSDGYVPNMWIADNYKLTGSLHDESGIKSIKITGDLKNGTEYNLAKALADGWIVEDTAHPPTESGKKNYKLQIPLTLSDLKPEAKEKQEFKFTLSVEEDTNKRLYAEKEFTFKIDTNAPTGAYGEHKLIGTGNFEAGSITDTDIATKIRELAPSTDYSKLGILAGGKALTIQSVTGDKVVFTPAIAAGEHNYVLYSKGASLIYNANGDWVVKGVAHDEGIGVKEVKVTVTVNGSPQTLTIPENRLVSSLSGLWSWEGQIDLSTLSDGKGTLSYEITDKRDNKYTPPAIEVRVKNKPVKISKVTLQTEIGGQTVKTDKTDPAETDPQTTVTKTMDAGLNQTVTVEGKNFAFKSKTASKIKVEFAGEQQGTVKYRLKKGDTTIGDNLRSIPSDKEIVLTEDDLTAIGNSNGSTPSTITLEFWDEAHGFIQGTDSSWAKVNITTLFDALDQTNPAVVILPFHWNSETDNSLYQNSRANGHVEIDSSSVSGKVTLRGFAYDNSELNEITATLPNDPTEHPTAALEVKATQQANGTWSSNKTMATDGVELTVKKLGADYLGYYAEWQLDWDTENATVAAAAKEITVQAKDGSNNTSALPPPSPYSGTDMPTKTTVARNGEDEAENVIFAGTKRGQFVMFKNGETQYLTRITSVNGNKVTLKDTVPTKATDVYMYGYTANKSAVKVNVVPYITGVSRNSTYNTKRARSGAIPLLRGEEDNTLTGFNFTTGSGTSLTITANKDGTGSALEMENLTLSGSSYTFKVPDTAKDGYLHLVVNGVAAVNNTNAYTASNTEESDTYGAEKHSDDRFVHIWRVSKEDTFTGSKNAVYPAMTKDSNGTLYASFCNNSTAAVYYSKQFTGGTPVVVEEHGVNGVRRMFTGYDPPEETDIIVTGGEVNVLYAASYQGGNAYQWGNGTTSADGTKKYPWNDTNYEYAGGIYLYDKDAASSGRHSQVYRFELYTYDNELQQFKNIRTVRSGNNIYVVYYDALTAAVKFAWVDDSKKPDTRIHALPWCVIDGNTDITDRECKVPDHLENTPGANPPDNVFTFVSPNGSTYASPYILNNFEDGLTVSKGVWESVDVTLTKDGYPVVAYIDVATGGLRLARSTSKQPTSPDDWKIQKVLDSSDKNGKTASDCVNACIGSDGILHIAFQNTRGQLVYVKSTNTSDTGSAKYAFGASEVLDDSGTSIEMTMDGTAPYITYMFRPNSYDAIRIAYKTSMDFNNTGVNAEGWETMTAPLNQRAANSRICIATQAKHYVSTGTASKLPVAVGFKTNSDYRAAFYVGK